MAINSDNYLEALVEALGPVSGGALDALDHLCLIHVPAAGGEVIYHLALGDEPELTIARFPQAIWRSLEAGESVPPEPEADVSHGALPWDHPFFGVVNDALLDRCISYSDGRPGLDYYMLMGRLGGEPFARESWEPYGRLDRPWMTLVGALQAASKAAVIRGLKLEVA